VQNRKLLEPGFCRKQYDNSWELSSNITETQNSSL